MIANLREKITPADIADYFIALANETGDVMTNLKLQKLVYYAQAWYLAINKKPLFDEDFEAWVHGPVIPALYQTYKVNGSQPIISEVTISEVSKRLNPSVVKFLDEVAGVYMTFNAYALEAMTHQETPWIEARSGCDSDQSCTEKITKESMIAFYGGKISNKSVV